MPGGVVQRRRTTRLHTSTPTTRLGLGRLAHEEEDGDASHAQQHGADHHPVVHVSEDSEVRPACLLTCIGEKVR